MAGDGVPEVTNQLYGDLIANRRRQICDGRTDCGRIGGPDREVRWRLIAYSQRCSGAPTPRHSRIVWRGVSQQRARALCPTDDFLRLEFYGAGLVGIVPLAVITKRLAARSSRPALGSQERVGRQGLGYRRDQDRPSSPPLSCGSAKAVSDRAGGIAASVPRGHPVPLLVPCWGRSARPANTRISWSVRTLTFRELGA